MRHQENYSNFSVPRVTTNKKIDLSPVSSLFCRQIQGEPSHRLLKVLFDSGASHTLIHQRILPRDCKPMEIKNGRTLTQTAAGTFNCNKTVRLRKLTLPEFDCKKQIYGVVAHIFSAPCNYDIILGRDFLSGASKAASTTKPARLSTWTCFRMTE